MTIPPIPADIQAVFDRWPAAGRTVGYCLRDLIYRVSQETQTGPLQETLKCGQPAYLTAATGAGTTVRIGYVADEPLACRIYVHCATTLVDGYRILFPDALNYAGNRAICLSETASLPREALRRCIAMALTDHRDKG
ncbi:DUF1801 domain-containing protein [Sedimentitalea sp. HM32M-2]|uniref:DUF1801 domain-containing protein n=1 Tax=Sedimentitalea sp. HM32M-2 TaxID=3351566 RepID=UPI00363C6F87